MIDSLNNRLRAYGRPDPKSRTEIGKRCLQCGNEIKARVKEVNWARKHKQFCSKRCGSQWNGKHRDNMSITSRMRQLTLLPENLAKRSAGMRKSPKVQRLVERLHTDPDLIRKAQDARDKMPGFQPVPEHYSAKWWKVRDPRGVAHVFRNLCYFIRQHPGLFLPEDVLTPGYTSRCRAYGGISSIRPSPTRRTVNGSWKGWTWAATSAVGSVGNDLLERETKCQHE